MNLAPVQFVNIHGHPVDTDKRIKLPKRDSKAPGEFHKGYAVEGFPPGSLEAAKEAHEKARAGELSSGSKRVRDEWSEAAWMAKAKTKRVRTKPYELVQAAMECKALAEKAGWFGVEVRSLSKGA
jgi:hypothetical protein